MSLATSFQHAELTAPTAELRSLIAEMRREMEILRRREEIREAEISRLVEELEQAGRLQQQLVAGALPVLRGASLSVFAHPAERISGDFHHVGRTSHDRVSLLVADSTGHGMAAGMLSAAVMAVIRNEGYTSQAGSREPAAALNSLNRQLLSYSLPDCEFVTAVCAEYNEKYRTLRWSRAGAPLPILLRGESTVRRLDSPGLPLGVDATAFYCCAEVQLAPGDKVLLHTDGLEALHTQCTGSRDERDFLAWVKELSDADLQSSLREQTGRCARKSQSYRERDDTTLLQLHITD